MNTANEAEPDVDQEDEYAGCQLPAKVQAQPLQRPEPAPAMTPAQAKVNAIAELTHTAYQKAATLQMTAEEAAKLAADFPDNAFQRGAAGKEQLLYIEHAHLRDRFNAVFGPGQWAIIPRNRWAEDFTFVNKDGKRVDASRVYVEAMLLVRGCFVAEAVGDMVYYKNNESQNYGDAVEGAKTAAFRRCAKELGVGLQAWKKDWCLGWWQRQRAPRNIAPAPGVPPPRPKPAPPAPKPAAPVETEDEKKTRWLKLCLEAGGGKPDYATEVFLDMGWILDTEDYKAISASVVPKTKKDAQHILDEIRRRAGIAPPEDVPAGEAGGAENVEEYDKPDAAWRSFIVPFGKMAGKTLGELDKKFLFGLWANYEPQETWIAKDGNPRKTAPDRLAKDRAFRAALDDAGFHYEFTDPDEPENDREDVS